MLLVSVIYLGLFFGSEVNALKYHTLLARWDIWATDPIIDMTSTLELDSTNFNVGAVIALPPVRSLSIFVYDNDKALAYMSKRRTLV